MMNAQQLRKTEITIEVQTGILCGEIFQPCDYIMKRLFGERKVE